MKYCLLMLMIVLPISHAFAKFTDDTNTAHVHFVVVPGMNGKGGWNVVWNDILNPTSIDHIRVAKTPNTKIDLGQRNCIEHLRQSIEELLMDDSVKDIVIHASSQGTATTLNYVAQNPKKIKAIILEAMFGSGNSFLNHWAKSEKYKGTFEGLKYNETPYQFPFSKQYKEYSPEGIQAIFSTQSIPNTIPIVIVHAEEDPQTSIRDAYATYYALQQTGNPNVYLIVLPKFGHISLLHLQENTREIAAINQIFKLHHLPYNDSLLSNEGDLDLSPFQPNNPIFKESYETLIFQENTIRSRHQSLF